MKRLVIALLVLIGGVAGNLIAAWIQGGAEKILGINALVVAAAVAGFALLVVWLLETGPGLAWNWWWHRFWYLWELGHDPVWKGTYARLEAAHHIRRLPGAEVIADGERQDLVRLL